MPKRDTETITLGSGKLYCVEFTDTIPVDATIETEANILGYISGGASMEYKPEFYEAKDDLGVVQKDIITAEEVKLKSGIMTWNGDTLKKLSSTARVTENTTTGKRTVKIGGVNNNDGKNYILRFVHTDAADGNVRVTIVGKNRSGFTLGFTKDKETVVDAEFVANPKIDTDGTLVIYEEDIDIAAG